MRLNERSFVVAVAAVVAIAAVAALVLSLSSGDGGAGDPAGARENSAAALAGGPDEILYLSGSTLVRRDIEAGEEQPIEDFPTPDVYAAPGSTWLAYVTSKQVKDDDFATEPVLHLYDTASQEKEGFGPGVAPVWNPSGTHVAFLRPIEPRDCLGEECRGESQIGVLDAETGEETVLLDPGRYTVLGWAGDWVLVSDFSDPSKVISVSLDDDRAALDMPASQFWGASPDGRWVVKTNAKKTEFIAIEDGELGDERIPVKLGDQELFEGRWSHDSAQVAAVTGTTSAVESAKGKKNKDKKNKDKKSKDKKDKKDAPRAVTTQVVTFSPDGPEPVMVEESYGATGGVLWAVDNEAIVFTSLLDPKTGLFQAKHCPVGNEGECTIVTSWTEGVELLRVE